MKTILPALLLAISLAACGKPADTTDITASALETSGAPAAKVFTARGNEPGWSLTISDKEIELIWNYGEDRLTTPTPRPDNTDGTLTYSVPESDLYIVVNNQLCNDDATGMPHPHWVTVVVGGASLRGCGGDPADVLIGGEWIVEDINHEGVIDNSRATMIFDDDGRVFGSGSCNSYSGTYEITGEGVTFGPIAATKKACAMALMDQEMKFFAVLASAQRFEINEKGALVLIGDEVRLHARKLTQ